MRSLRQFFIVALALRMLLGVVAFGQDVSAQRVDQVFSIYDKPGSPGCSLGVIRDGDFVYRKAYGLANLELGVPLSPQSVFYMGDGRQSEVPSNDN
jgi:CubicO group peptidase (beta-lactamase class C family)